MHRTFNDNVKEYYRDCKTKSSAHYVMAEKFRCRHRTLGLFVVSLSALVGTSIFATLQSTGSSVIKTVGGFLAIGAVVLSAMQTFLGFSELQAKHKIASAGYKTIERKLEILMMENQSSKDLSDQSTKDLKSIIGNLDEIDRISPVVPAKILDKEREKIY